MVLGRALVFRRAAYDGRAMPTPKQINAQRTLRFFGGVHPVAPPVGLRCWYCTAPFAHDSSGLWFEREHGCYPSHPRCFANAAVSAYLERFVTP